MTNTKLAFIPFIIVCASLIGILSCSKEDKMLPVYGVIFFLSYVATLFVMIVKPLDNEQS